MNKFEITLQKLNEAFPNIPGILIIFLFGSVSRGDFSLRHSDLDLFIIVKKKIVTEKLKEKLDAIIMPIGFREGVKIQTEYQGLDITYEDRTLVRKMIQEGKIIYSTGVFTFDYQQVGLQQYIIYDFSLKNATSPTMFSKVLHGRKSWYWKSKEKVVKEYPGIIDGEKIIELGKGVIMVLKQREKDLKHIFGQFKVDYKMRKIVYA